MGSTVALAVIGTDTESCFEFSVIHQVAKNTLATTITRKRRSVLSFASVVGT